MRENPRDWRIEDLRMVAASHGLDVRQQGTSHVVFRHPSGRLLTVPAARPIKPVYVRQFVKLVGTEEIGE